MRIGDSDTSERYVASWESPVKLSLEYFDCGGGLPVVMVLKEASDSTSYVSWARGGLRATALVVIRSS